MKNYESRPTGSIAFPEANMATYNYGRERGGGRGRCGGRGRRFSHGYSRGQGTRGCGSQIQNHPLFKFDKSNANQKLEKNMDKEKKKKTAENECYRCGMKGYWSRTCRKPKHLVDLYQASLKDKGKNVETNLVFEDKDYVDNLFKMTYLDTADLSETLDDTTTPNDK
ncbi:uncharacterized protein LOC141690758 [Apium graveolens]|uniref:uncharacterized protein LOC141690758 n=1 Tax=Apium graveolens TaxID=4045 RepID=UPI003D7B8D7F